MVKALVVIAHPDDETIWCGGTILSHPDWDWTVLSLCRKHDKDRAPKFREACRQLNAKCTISDLEDEKPEQSLSSLGEVKSRIVKMLAETRAGNRFDFIFTHGENGEYNHNRHKEVHNAVREMIESSELQCRKIFFFNYKLAEDATHCEPDTATADSLTRLSGRITRKKNLLISSTYKFNVDSFEKRSCFSIESFKVKEA